MPFRHHSAISTQAAVQETNLECLLRAKQRVGYGCGRRRRKPRAPITHLAVSADGRWAAAARGMTLMDGEDADDATDSPGGCVYLNSF